MRTYDPSNVVETTKTSGAFDKLLNFRDVAQSVNEFYGRSLLKTGLLYRSARPDSASAADWDILRRHYGIRTVLDLRTHTEHIEAAKRFKEATDAAKVASPPTAETSAAKPMRQPGLRYIDVNVNGKGFERHLLWQLGSFNIAKLAGLMMFGYRVEAIRIMGTNVLQPRGLIGLGRDTLDHSGPEIKQVFDELASTATYPVLIHCTQGKDRTGLVVMLALIICGIGVDAISQDYILSEHELKAEFEDRMKEISSIGLDDSFAKCPSDLIAQLKQHLDHRYGGAEQYLRQTGITESQLSTIKTRLLV